MPYNHFRIKIVEYIQQKIVKKVISNYFIELLRFLE